MMQTTSAQGNHHLVTEDEDRYDEFAERLRQCVAKATGPLFTTDTEHLFDLFLSQLPADRRQHYNCRLCRQFVDRFGHLVTISESGEQVPVLWSLPQDVPPFFAVAVSGPEAAVRSARVTGVFLSSEPMWGTPFNVSAKGVRWNHLHAPSPVPVFRNALLNAGQVMAEKLQDFGTLSRGLAEFSLPVVSEAHRLLTVGGLYRSEKAIGAAKWLLDLHMACAPTKNRRTIENLRWRAVATAPAGFCHVRSTMIGTLLEDVAAGRPFEELRRSFDAKMNPLFYQRPQTAPTDAQLAAAEAVIEKLASAGSLARRFATLEDLERIYKLMVGGVETTTV